MKKKRLIPVLLLRNGFLVQSKGFGKYKNIGNPVSAVKRFSEWGADELIYLDISNDDHYDLKRDDLGCKNRGNIIDIIDDVSKVTFMPITVGGKIRNIADIEKRLAVGADKISINTMALKNPQFIKEASREFGAQCIVVSIDIKRINGKSQVVSEGGKTPAGIKPEDWAKTVEELGAGEILLNSVDRDGMKSGYDIELLNTVTNTVNIPVIACGGVGEWTHLSEALELTKVDAVSAANIFHHREQSLFLAKTYLYQRGHHVRSPELIEL